MNLYKIDYLIMGWHIATREIPAENMKDALAFAKEEAWNIKLVRKLDGDLLYIEISAILIEENYAFPI